MDILPPFLKNKFKHNNKKTKNSILMMINKIKDLNLVKIITIITITIDPEEIRTQIIIMVAIMVVIKEMVEEEIFKIKINKIINPINEKSKDDFINYFLK